MKPNKTSTLAQTLDYYRQHVSILKKSYSQEAYRIAQISRMIGDQIVGEVTSVNIADYRDMRLSTLNPRTKRMIAPSTVRLELSLLSSLFDVARIEWGAADANPVANVRKPKVPPGRDRRLTAREERLILRCANAHPNKEFYSILIVALETAMRQGEILKLQWEHINLKGRIAHLPDTKNGSKRDVPLSIKARDALTKLGTKTKGPVFGYSNEGLKSTWRFMRIKLNIENLHFHDLRHEAISRLFELGTLDMMEIAAISGHKSLAMLKRYTHLKAQRLVRKLEGNRSKGKQAIIDHLIPYPAQIVRFQNETEIRLLDFEAFIVKAKTDGDALLVAQDALLRRIINSIRDEEKLPPPDQYLENIDENQIVMIDPLANHCFV